MKRLLLAFLLLGVSLFVGCGGSSGGSTPPPTATLQSMTITPSSPTISAGSTQQFTATGTYADGTTSVLTSTVTWASSTPAVAKISNSAGTQGLATGIAPGNTSITATLGPITSLPAALTVTNATLTSIAVAPATASIELGYQQTYAATGTFSDGSTLTITTS